MAHENGVSIEKVVKSGNSLSLSLFWIDLTNCIPPHQFHFSTMGDIHVLLWSCRSRSGIHCLPRGSGQTAPPQPVGRGLLHNASDCGSGQYGLWIFNLIGYHILYLSFSFDRVVMYNACNQHSQIKKQKTTKTGRQMHVHAYISFIFKKFLLCMNLMILNRIIIWRLNLFLLQFGTIEPVFTALSDSFRIWRKRRALLTALFSTVCFLVGLIMCTEVSIFFRPPPPSFFFFLSLMMSSINTYIYMYSLPFPI